MALHLHLGSAGSGKTTGLHSRILKEASADIRQSFLIVVPEQFTLQTQREIIEKSEQQGMFNIDVLSFARLTHRVFEELGITMLPILEDTGKGMIVKKVAEENREKLVIYRNKVSNRGFIEEMKSLIAEFYQYGIGSEEIAEMLELSKDRKQLVKKLKDISVIYEGFAEFIKGRFCMNEEITDRLCEVAGKSELLKGSVLAFDCFTGFTPSQYNCLRSLFRIAGDIHITLTISPEAAETVPSEQSLFYLSQKTIMKLEKMADAEGVNVIRHYYDGAAGRFADNEVLNHLEKNIFRFPYGTMNLSDSETTKKNCPDIPAEGTDTSKCEGGNGAVDNECIAIMSCDSKEHEIRYLIAKIREQVFERGCRFGDIAVVTGDVNDYAGSFAVAAEKAGIPVFIDEKKNIKTTSVVELLESAIEIVRTDFSYDSVFRFLKTGLTDIDTEQISVMENLVLRCGIRGRKRWNSDWRFTGKNFNIDEDALKSINETRAALSSLIMPLYDCEQTEGGPTVRQRLAVLYGLLDACNVEDKLYVKSNILGASKVLKDRIAAREKSLLFRTVIDVFNRIDGLMSEERLSLKEFSDILDTGFCEAKLRNIPGGADSVVLGDIERTRLSNKRIVFFIGVTDSVIPKQQGAAGILSDYDRSLFEENDIELSPTKKENAYLSEFYLYLALTRPSERLYMSFPRMSSDCKEARPAYIIGRLQKIFPGLKVMDFEGLKKDENPYLMLGEDRGLTALTDALRENEIPEEDFRRYFGDADLGETVSENSEENASGDSGRAGSGEAAGECRICEKDGASYYLLSKAELSLLEMFARENRRLVELLGKATQRRNTDQRITPETAEKLYGETIRGSITRLQDYASCAFMHYLKYGLGIKERDEYSFTGLEIGNIYHKALEIYGRLVGEKGKSWRDVSSEEQKSLQESAVTEALAEYIDIVEDSKRNEYFKQRLNRVLDRSITTITKQIAAGGFEVKYLEKSFNHTNRYLSMTGKIDRIDVGEKNGKTYIRVIDYKSGRQVFDLNRLYYGLQLQLSVYLCEAGRMLSNEKPVSAGGMFYYRVDDPIIEAGKGDIEQERDKKLMLDGVSSDEPEVLGLQDSSLIGDDGLAGGAKSNVIDVTINKDGTFKYGGKKLLSREKMDFLSEFTAEKTLELTKEIKDGRADINPYSYNKNKPCEYCGFGAICMFRTSRGDEYRALDRNAADKFLWEKMNGNKLDEGTE